MRTPQEILQEERAEALATVYAAREATALLRAAMELRHTPLGDPLPLSQGERAALERLESLVGRPA